MHITVSTAPSVEPVAAAETKTFVGIDSGDSSWDDLITQLIETARQRVEAYTGRALITQTVTIELDAADARSPIYLPMPPYQSLTSFQTYDTASNLTAVDTSLYEVVGTDPAYIGAMDAGWSLYRGRRAAKIVAVVGYGDAAGDVPDALRTAVMRIVATQFEYREDYEAGSILRPVPDDAMAMMEPYRVRYM